MIILQLIFNLLLISTVFNIANQYHLKINIHNLPIIIIFGSFCMMCGYLSICNYKSYILIGLFFGALSWIFNSIEIPNMPKFNFTRKISVSACLSVAWPQIITLIMFLIFNYKKINLNEKL